MYKKSFWLFLIYFSLVLSMQAQFNLNDPIPSDPNVKVGKLPNGLTYYIQQNKKPEKKVELRLVINAGSVLERDDQQGLAHFLEHMAFNGTKNFKKNELVSFLQSVGVNFGPDLNAFTSQDETIFVLPLPTERKELIDKGLLILSDWASGMTLEQEEIDKERGVILEEIRQRKDSTQRMREKYFSRIYPGTPYANRFPGGRNEIIQTFNRKSLVDFYETWYRPDLMAIVVVGDIDVNEIEAKIKAQFSSLKAIRESGKRPVYPVPDNKETLVAIETDKEAQNTSAIVIYKKPAISLKKIADLRQNTINLFFLNLLNARLNEIGQSPNAPFIEAGIYSFPLFRTKHGFLLSAGSNAQGIKQAISALLTENKRVREFGFTKAELDRQKESAIAYAENNYKEREKLESSAYVEKYVSNFLNDTPILSTEFDYQFYKTVVPTITLEEVNAFAKTVFTEDNRIVVITGTAREDIKYPTEAEILNLFKETETAKVTAYTENVISEPLVKELPATAKITDEKFDEKFGITSWTLSNGVKVILKPTDFQSDVITMEAYSPGGLSLVGDEKFKSALFFNQIVGASGLNKFSNVELGKMLTGKRAEASISLGRLFEFANGSSTPKDFETMLQLTYLKFTGVNFDRAVFDSIISKQKATMPGMMANPQVYFFDQIRQTLEQNHSRSYNPYDVVLLDNVKLEDIETIYKERFADASDFTFIFVGNFEKETVKPQILKYLGNLPSLSRKEDWKDVGIKTPDGKIEKVIKKGVDDKSLVNFIFTGNAVYDEIEAQNVSALGELLNYKLFEILREEKGGVYTPEAAGYMSKLPVGKFRLEIIFSCSPANVESLIKATLAEVAKIRNGQIDEKDIDKVKQFRLVKIRENIKTNSYWSTAIANNVTEGYKILALEEAEKRINSINKGDLQKAAQKYLTPENMKQFVLMPEADKK